MRVPHDWDAESSGGYFPHFVHLVHKPCGFRTEMAYDLWGSGAFGESAARQMVFSHRCEPDN